VARTTTAVDSAVVLGPSLPIATSGALLGHEPASARMRTSARQRSVITWETWYWRIDH
jgi:hypothetical protein